MLEEAFGEAVGGEGAEVDGIGVAVNDEFGEGLAGGRREEDAPAAVAGGDEGPGSAGDGADDGDAVRGGGKMAGLPGVDGGPSKVGGETFDGLLEARDDVVPDFGVAGCVLDDGGGVGEARDVHFAVGPRVDFRVAEALEEDCRAQDLRRLQKDGVVLGADDGRQPFVPALEVALPFSLLEAGDVSPGSHGQHHGVRLDHAFALAVLGYHAQARAGAVVSLLEARRRRSHHFAAGHLRGGPRELFHEFLRVHLGDRRLVAHGPVAGDAVRVGPLHLFELLVTRLTPRIDRHRLALEAPVVRALEVGAELGVQIEADTRELFRRRPVVPVLREKATGATARGRREAAPIHHRRTDPVVLG
mmetsp:Transcript_3242/g.10736  ORF Transcript_3242/g.10736 Transcript_3242/m.10736 type:complete len:359 (+) Transcript_3242:143-1219(+)